jgi:hypothetical protein
MTLINLRFYKILTIALTLLSTFSMSQTYAQETTTHSSHCRFNGVSENINRPGETESTGTSGTGANIDVLYHKIYWRINPDSAVKYIKGSVQTILKPFKIMCHLSVSICVVA